MYKESLKFSLKCPKHKSFTPINGAQSIKGGCIFCGEIYNIYAFKTDLEGLIKEFKEHLEKEN